MLVCNTVPLEIILEGGCFVPFQVNDCIPATWKKVLHIVFEINTREPRVQTDSGNKKTRSILKKRKKAGVDVELCGCDAIWNACIWALGCASWEAAVMLPAHTTGHVTVPSSWLSLPGLAPAVAGLWGTTHHTMRVSCVSLSLFLSDLPTPATSSK